VVLLKSATLRALLDGIIELTLAAEQIIVSSWLEAGPDDVEDDERELP
jgi:hypothetical protein